MNQSVTNALLVGFGGFAGSILRYWVSGWVQSAVSQSWRPAGTFAVNVTGCFLIGFLMGMADFRQLLKPDARLLLVVGLLGGFTTFSAFGYETFALARDKEFGAALLNIGAQVVVGLAAVWAGYTISRVA
ncbi:MAG: fluoride efflux transporter CrcB [Candidatus Hydrogenedentes bacterium]|nr:fluoride efflux transporter CrcB [Candidatus Hydrogenedentota bacterium]